MKDMPLKKIRNFGGKLGAELQALGCSTAGEVLALPPATLQEHFGERATWILYTVQGNSDEQVQVRVARHPFAFHTNPHCCLQVTLQ